MDPCIIRRPIRALARHRIRARCVNSRDADRAFSTSRQVLVNVQALPLSRHRRVIALRINVEHSGLRMPIIQHATVSLERSRVPHNHRLSCCVFQSVYTMELIMRPRTFASVPRQPCNRFVPPMLHLHRLVIHHQHHQPRPRTLAIIHLPQLPLLTSHRLPRPMCRHRHRSPTQPPSTFTQQQARHSLPVLHLSERFP